MRSCKHAHHKMMFHYVMILLLTEILAIGVHSWPLSLLLYVRGRTLGRRLLFPSSDHTDYLSGGSSCSSKSSRRECSGLAWERGGGKNDEEKEKEGNGNNSKRRRNRAGSKKRYSA